MEVGQEPEGHRPPRAPDKSALDERTQLCFTHHFLPPSAQAEDTCCFARVLGDLKGPPGLTHSH